MEPCPFCGSLLSESLQKRPLVQKITKPVIFQTASNIPNLIMFELENAIKHYDVKLVVITNLLHYFTNDPYLDSTEMERILDEIVQSLKKIKDCLVIISLDSQTRFNDVVHKLFSITIKIESSNSTLSVDVNNDGRHSSVILRNDELESIQQ